MSFYDDLLAKLNASTLFDATTRSTLTAFLQTQRPVLEPLGPALLTDFLTALQNGGGPAAVDTLVANLDEPALLTLLQQTGPEIQAAIDRRAATTARFDAFMNDAATLALQLLAHLLLAAL
jgi:hypothetical protein